MSINTLTASNTEALPFFAHFLEYQSAAEPSEDPPSNPSDDDSFPLPPPIYTLKFPSDWEDR
ncbi:microviridin/marinostatin family tricyclic proteinase inhibitor [Nostoc sp. FACHB-110]|uniref:microviridin/marinostatin family tricyclic proteinase inhibitor n=1 Tax=Nostoc sp. FACHB-110 TaxID=2692834 RepID=UPI001687C1C5|nr:microviridin/marinostatin family tricyclic proteinase inhibitor [Nostoc sp. FACHB-110]MBD2435525.1 microviridin/marinostatin family tricyclic proteinase inhibitor [Nostoc sp. FACHB-110]